MAKQFLLIYMQIHLLAMLDLHLFQLRVLIFLINYNSGAWSVKAKGKRWREKKELCAASRNAATPEGAL
jgi:hypothetical protein